MPRRPPHFKAFTSIKNHEKLRQVYGNNALLALWLRLGVEGIERYADRHGDTFLVHDRELTALTGIGRLDRARHALMRLAESSPIKVEAPTDLRPTSGRPEADLSPTSQRPVNDLWRITFPNFAKKQFSRSGNGVETGTPSSSSSTSYKKGALAPAKKSKRVERREKAQRLYTVEQLISEPSEEALAAWEAAGCPAEKWWWIPREERLQLRVVL